MSVLTCTIFVVLGCIFGQQNVEAQGVNPAYTQAYFPYHSTLGFDRPTYLSTETDQQLLAIASLYSMKPDHIYELYSTLNSYPFLTIDQDLAILNRLAALVERKRQQSGMVYPAFGNYDTRSRQPPAFNLMARRDPQMISGLINDMRSNLSSAIDNMTSMGEYYFPRFTSGLHAEINDIMNTGLPTEVINNVAATVDEADSLTSRMTRSISNMISDLW